MLSERGAVESRASAEASRRGHSGAKSPPANNGAQVPAAGCAVDRAGCLANNATGCPLAQSPPMAAPKPPPGLCQKVSEALKPFLGALITKPVQSRGPQTAPALQKATQIQTLHRSWASVSQRPPTTLPGAYHGKIQRQAISQKLEASSPNPNPNLAPSGLDRSSWHKACRPPSKKPRARPNQTLHPPGLDRCTNK